MGITAVIPKIKIQWEKTQQVGSRYPRCKNCEQQIPKLGLIFIRRAYQGETEIDVKTYCHDCYKILRGDPTRPGKPLCPVCGKIGTGDIENRTIESLPLSDPDRKVRSCAPCYKNIVLRKSRYFSK